MAREVQRPGARALGRPYLRQRADARAPVAPVARLSRHLGPRAVSVALGGWAELAGGAAADAGMVPGVRVPDGTVGAKLRLEPAHAFAAVAHRRRPATARAGWPERGPRFIPGRAATQGGPAEAAVVDGSAPSAPAARPPAWAAQRRPHSLALPRRLTTGTALAGDDLHVERALAGSGPEAQFHRSRPPSGGRLRAPRQRARPLGLGGTVRVPWGRPAAHGGRRPRRRAIRAPSVVARRPGMGPGLHLRLRGSRPWRVSRPRLAGRRRPWPHGSVARAAHAPAVHGCHGDDHAGPETTP